MNIFVTSMDPILAAQALDDIRLNKMIVESVQMLATAMFINGAKETNLPKSRSGNAYRPTHIKHPCTLWAAKNRYNYRWLLEHLIALIDEYTHRTGKVHFCATGLSNVSFGEHLISNSGALESFQNSSAHTNIADVHIAYRMTLDAKWINDKIKVKWTKRQPPHWTTIRTISIGDTYFKV